MDDRTPPIVLVNGTRDRDGDAWIGDFSHDELFWVALRISPDKLDAFNEAYRQYENLGITFDIEDYAEKIVKEGKPGMGWPSAEELEGLKQAYGHQNIRDMNGNNGNPPASDADTLNL